MKKTYAISFLIIGMLFSTFNGIAQRNCATTKIYEQLLENNSTFREKRRVVELHSASTNAHPSQMRGTVTIPVVVHIIWRKNYPIENVTDAQVQSQIDVLNKDFRKLNADVGKTPSLFQAADCEINFCKAQRTPTGLATNGINRVESSRTTDWGSDDQVKNPSFGGVAPWYPNKYLNIYVCSIGGGILGYSLFPGAPADQDAVVIDYRFFGTINTVSPPYHLGRTATHEVGHWLDLYHIWGDTNCGNDYVDDTPAQSNSNTGCPPFPKISSCNGSTEMTMNYMDYTNDGCMYMFSEGQKVRMQALFSPSGARYSLTQSDGCVPVPNTQSCGIPSAVAASKIATDNALISWQPILGATSYTVFFKSQGSTTWVQNSTSTNNFTLSGLNQNTYYQVQVSASCNGVESTKSIAAYFKTIINTTANCGSPATIIIGNVGVSSAKISWSAVPNALSYLYKYRIAGTAPWVSITTNGLSVSISGLNSNVLYDFEICSKCADGFSVSQTKQFKTATKVTCDTPTSLSVIDITATTAKVVWSAVAGATSYTVIFKPTSGGNAISNSSSTNSFTLSGLQSNTSYSVQVSTNCNGVNGTPTSLSIFKTTALTCSNTPSSILISTILTNSVSISWTNTVNATSYTLKYKKSSTTSWVEVKNIYSIPYTLSGLTPYTTYDVQLSATCINGIVSAYSSVKSFTTAVLPVCVDKYENNNTFQAAKVIAANSSINANIGSSSDQDWFKFPNTTNQKNIQVTLSNITADYEVKLYNTSGALLATGKTLTNSSKQLKWATSSTGNFSIQVFTNNGVSNTQSCYSLKVELSSTAFKSAGNREIVMDENLDIAQEVDVFVSPNPILDYGRIKAYAKQGGSFEMFIMDMSGHFIRREEILLFEGENYLDLDAINLESGLYIVQLSNGVQRFNAKFMVAKE